MVSEARKKYNINIVRQFLIDFGLWGLWHKYVYYACAASFFDKFAGGSIKSKNGAWWDYDDVTDVFGKCNFTYFLTHEIGIRLRYQISDIFRVYLNDLCYLDIEKRKETLKTYIVNEN